MIANDSIAARLQQVRTRIGNATTRAGRAPNSVELLAVSKHHGADAIRAAMDAGQRAFGESYVQEALDKQQSLSGLPIQWHFIGRIQANKTRSISTHFDWVHGLADPGHARRLSDQRPDGMPPLKVFLQVNLSGEATKGGLHVDAVTDLLNICSQLPRIRVMGLMTLPSATESLELQRQPFRALRQLRDRLATPQLPLDCLSMGMSADLEAAILEGATLVRIGTAVFGPRPYNGRL